MTMHRLCCCECPLQLTVTIKSDVLVCAVCITNTKVTVSTWERTVTLDRDAIRDTAALCAYRYVLDPDPSLTWDNYDVGDCDDFGCSDSNAANADIRTRIYKSDRSIEQVSHRMNWSDADSCETGGGGQRFSFSKSSIAEGTYAFGDDVPNGIVACPDGSGLEWGYNGNAVVNRL